MAGDNTVGSQPSLQDCLRAMYEIVRARDAGTQYPNEVGPMIGECDWLAELHRLLEPIVGRA